MGVQEEIAAIRAKQAEDAEKVAAAERVEAESLAALDAVKARCTAACGEVQAAVAAAKDPAERIALIALEERTHAEHAADLEAAYAAFQNRHGEFSESNPATPGEEPNDLGDVHVVVSADMAPVPEG